MGSVFRMQPSPLIPLFIVAMVVAMVVNHSSLVSQILQIEEEDDYEYEKGIGELLFSLIIVASGKFLLLISSMVPGLLFFIVVLIMALHFLQ